MEQLTNHYTIDDSEFKFLRHWDNLWLLIVNTMDSVKTTSHIWLFNAYWKACTCQCREDGKCLWSRATFGSVEKVIILICFSRNRGKCLVCSVSFCRPSLWFVRTVVKGETYRQIVLQEGDKHSWQDWEVSWRFTMLKPLALSRGLSVRVREYSGLGCRGSISGHSWGPQVCVLPLRFSPLTALRLLCAGVVTLPEILRRCKRTRVTCQASGGTPRMAF